MTSRYPCPQRVLRRNPSVKGAERLSPDRLLKPAELNPYQKSSVVISRAVWDSIRVRSGTGEEPPRILRDAKSCQDYSPNREHPDPPGPLRSDTLSRNPGPNVPSPVQRGGLLQTV